MNVIWDNEVSIPDAKVDEWAATVVKHGLNEVRAGTVSMINAIRLEVIRGNIKHTDVTFSFKDRIIHINKHGTLSAWPEGFADKHIAQTMEIMRGVFA